MRRRTGEMEPVSFRLPPEDFAVLGQLAEATNSSPHLAARHVVLMALRGGQPSEELEASLSEVFGQLAGLHDDMSRLQHVLVTVLETVLVNVRPESADTIRSWVSSKFAREELPSEDLAP